MKYLLVLTLILLENITENQQGPQFTQSRIQAGSALDGMTLKAANIEEKTRLIIIAIQDQAGAFFYNPPGEQKLQPVMLC